MIEQIGYTFVSLFAASGFAHMTLGNLLMIAISFLLVYLAITKGIEPLLVLPIAFGMFLANLPLAGIMSPPVHDLRLLEYIVLLRDGSYIYVEAVSGGFVNSAGRFFSVAGSAYYQIVPVTAELVRSGVLANVLGLGESFSIIGERVYIAYTQTGGGLMHYFYMGIGLVIFPPLIFLGVGAMVDFGPLIAFPSSFLMGAAAQLGILAAFMGALAFGFSPQEAAAVGIVGSADGPTAIFITAMLSPHLMGAVAVAAYTYMALVPIIQPPFMKLLTTNKERRVVMKQLRPVSKTEKIVFPIVCALGVSLLVPPATPLIGMLMLGNLIKESGVCERLSKTAQNELINIVTILLALAVGATASAERFLTRETLLLTGLGLFAFIVGTISGVLFGKLMYVFTGGKVNPLIGSAAVSAMPMAARVSQQVGAQYDRNNFLLMHAMGPNVSGIIASAVLAGAFIALLG